MPSISSKSRNKHKKKHEHKHKPEKLTIKQASQKLEKSPAQIRRYVEQGILKSKLVTIKGTPTYMINETSVLKLLKKQQEKPEKTDEKRCIQCNKFSNVLIGIRCPQCWDDWMAKGGDILEGIEVTEEYY